MGNFDVLQNTEGFSQEIKQAVDNDRGRELKETILSGVEAFTSEVLDKYPQVSEKGKLNYYLSGSLGVMILLRSGKFEVLDESRIPEIVPIAENEVSPEAIKQFEGFVRKIGDLDFVPLGKWNKSENGMRKGSGGPKIAELSETAKKALEIYENQNGVVCDPLETFTPHRVARVKVNGKEVYISEPKMMLAYKTVHLGQTFENANKTDKFVKDFNTLLKGMEAIYPREELLQTTHETIFAYAPDLPNNTYIPYHNQKFNGELRKFYNEVLALDVDAPYLDQLQYGKERSIGVLKVLHHFQSPEAKQAIIDFFNQHRELIDKWSVNSTSPHNRDVIVDFLFSRQDLIDDFKTYIHMQGEATRDTITEALKVYDWAFDKYGNQMPDRSSLEMRPLNSTTMNILMKIDEKNIGRELPDVGELLESGMEDYKLKKMLGSKFLSDENMRLRLLDGCRSARAILPDEKFKQFTQQLDVLNSTYYDWVLNGFKDLKQGECLDRVASIFKQYGIEY